MVSGPKWFFEVHCTVLPNFQQAVGECDSTFTTNAFKTLTHRFRYCFRQAFPSKLGQLLREFVRFVVFDVKAHPVTILPLASTILPQPNPEVFLNLRSAICWGCLAGWSDATSPLSSPFLLNFALHPGLSLFPDRGQRNF